MRFSEIKRHFDSIRDISSTNGKKDYLKSIDDEDFKRFLVWLYDTSVISGISSKKINKDVASIFGSGSFTTCDMKDIFDVFRYLKNHKTGRDEDIEYVQYMRDQICADDSEKEFFNRVICKDVVVGMDVKLINSVYPNLVPTFEVCLCDKYYDRPELVDGTKEFAISVKIDGCRCIAIKEQGQVKLISRQGKPWTGLVEIERAIQALPSDNFIMDGEITIKNFMQYPSKEVYKMTTKIISTKEEEKKGVCLNVFDFMPLENWNRKSCDLAYYQRRFRLDELLRESDSDALSYVSDIYVGADVSKIEELMKGIVREDDWEGLVIKFTESPYEWKRSKNWLKVKAFDEMDLVITGTEEGTNANKGRLGALVCEVEHPVLGHIEAKVGSGYSEDERIRFWDMRDELIGRTISVQYFEQTENTSTHIKSLRFPVFLELKEEGQLPNN